MLEEIYNYLKLTEYIATGGQPLEDELEAVAKAGYEVVINLALADADYSLPDEHGLVTRLGMLYEHMPVIWEHPESKDLNRFFELMEKYQHKKRFIHCAANMRVSAFMALYRILKQGWDRDTAMADVRKIWNPDEIWTEFMETELTKRTESNQI